MTCNMWSERVKLESNTTPRFLTLCAGETLIPRILIGKLLMVVFEAVFSGFSFNLFVNTKFSILFRQFFNVL